MRDFSLPARKHPTHFHPIIPIPRWLLNAGGVFHGLGQEARPVLYSASTEAEPTDARHGWGVLATGGWGGSQGPSVI